jgi:hypothetical protein
MNTMRSHIHNVNSHPIKGGHCFRSPDRHIGMLCIIAVIERIGLRIVAHTVPLSLRHSLAQRIAGSTVGTPHCLLRGPLRQLVLLHLPLEQHIVERTCELSPQGSLEQ